MMKNIFTGMWCQAVSPVSLKRIARPPPPSKVVVRLPGAKQLNDLKVICNVEDPYFASNFTYTGYGFAAANSSAVDGENSTVGFDPTSPFGSNFDFWPSEPPGCARGCLPKGPPEKLLLLLLPRPQPLRLPCPPGARWCGSPPPNQLLTGRPLSPLPAAVTGVPVLPRPRPPPCPLPPPRPPPLSSVTAPSRGS
jgi:hypothetical protein